VKPDTPNKNIVDVIIAKHRNGPVGKVSLYFEDNSTTFRSLERVHSQDIAPSPAE
jgi:replicative DNA helicase